MTLKARITAIDRFIKGLKEDNIYTDLNACCVMAGWDSLAGALTPLKGVAPTNSGFIATDYDRGGIGITGDGTSYLNSGRAAGPQDNEHLAIYQTSLTTAASKAIAGAGLSQNGVSYFFNISTTNIGFRSQTISFDTITNGNAVGLVGMSRSSSAGYSARANGESQDFTQASQTLFSANHAIFTATTNTSLTDATIAFYSIGSSLGSDPATGLAALDARVSTLMADLRAIDEAGFDRDAIAYIRAVEAADGAYLETSVKIAINNLVSGLKADGLWESMASTCLLCGPRTLAGALVPLRGVAPTAYGFVDGDYDREGLAGDGTSYLDSNRSGVADARNDHHIAFYSTSAGGNTYPIGVRYGVAPTYYTTAGYDFYSRSASPGTNASSVSVGTYGLSRGNGTSFNWIRASGSVSSASSVSQEVTGNDSYFVFAINTAGSPAGTTSGTLAFYSIGTSIDLAKLDSHVAAYVTAIGAAI